MSPGRRADGAGQSDDGAGRADDRAGRVRTSLLWGLVGALAFLVLVQGYELVGGQPVTVGVKAGVALAVGVAATGLTYLAEGRLAMRARRE